MHHCRVMSVERTARVAVLLAAVAAMGSILLPVEPSTGWLSDSLAVAWALVALLALVAVRRSFLAGELLMAVLALSAGLPFLIGAFSGAGPAPLGGVQALLMTAGVVLFAIAHRTLAGHKRTMGTA